jgi:hypothetical protein
VLEYLFQWAGGEVGAVTDESYDMTTIEGCIGWGLFQNPPERRRLEAELARLRDTDTVLTRWGRLRAEYAALRGRQDHAPTHEESVAAWARMDELEAEIELAFLAVRVASDARGVGR